MAKKPKKKTNDNTIARNRKARFDYTIESNFEAGLARFRLGPPSTVMVLMKTLYTYNLVRQIQYEPFHN